ncbi:Beta-lactamase-like protein [alpha proteobacterium BAL199]|jgi:glyoxylase-like metal-dependent hydrolase (beta-lactamase superfamily II)|nr:Beta-lactamase-like protein [alpha proteobacterium BAL199]
MQARDDGTIRVENHGDGLWRIEELFAHPYCRGAIWVIDGAERRLVLDAGWGLVPLDQAVPELFDRPVVALASHTHFDHVGGLHRFAERLVHPLEASILADPTPEAVQSLPFLHGYDALAFDPVSGGFDADSWRLPPMPATATVEEGDRLELGGRTLTVLHTPGHSPGHVCLFEEATGFLFAADAIYAGEMFDTIPGASIPDLLATHQRLLELPVSRVFPGHFEVFDGRRLRKLIEAYRREKSA